MCGDDDRIFTGNGHRAAAPETFSPSTRKARAARSSQSKSWCAAPLFLPHCAGTARLLSPPHLFLRLLRCSLPLRADTRLSRLSPFLLLLFSSALQLSLLYTPLRQPSFNQAAHAPRLAVGEIVILLHPPSSFSRCVQTGCGRDVSKVTVWPTARGARRACCSSAGSARIFAAALCTRPYFFSSPVY